MELILDTIRWLIAVPAGLLFLLCALGNWSLIVGGFLGQVKSFSLVLPFLGPLFGIVMFVAIPIGGFSWYWWVAAIIEPTWLLGAWCLVTRPFIPRNRPPDQETGDDRSHG